MKDENTEPTTIPPATAPMNPEKKDAPTIPCSAPTAEVNVSAAGQSFGEYELLAEIGRGGMGVVFKARQQNLNRVVALKMVLSGSLSSPEEVRRFRTEAASTACLQHPHIVTVHTVGERDGRHYFSMDFIDGPSLAQRLAAGPLPGRVAARYLVTIARAIHHAHEHGILHRDLKPSNILLDSDDQPHITDFGLAKRIGDDSGHTRTGEVMGTPSYMAPEQAAGRNKDLGPASDIYSLGALLYEMISGRPPFRAETPLDTMLQVIEREPAPPRILNPKIDRDLETICLKCLEKEPRRRYASAEELAEELERFLKGDSITARSINVLDRLARTLERSHYDVEFHSWGTMLLLFAAIVLVAHALKFAFLLSRQSGWLIGSTQVFEFLSMGLVFWRFRSKRLLPTNAAERQLWSIWIGYLTACTLLAGSSRLIHGFDIERELGVYPAWTFLAGLGFFVMGGNYWGHCYAIGLAFFVIGMVMPLDMEWAPLEFGVLWSTVLVVVGLRLRTLGEDAGSGAAGNSPSGR